LFIVKDNGQGIKSQYKEKLQKMLQEDSAREEQLGYGLLNVHRRIQLEYGKAYGVQIESEIGKGTTVYITHPLIR
jgi:two-component system sensor histidine kinase YesM